MTDESWLKEKKRLTMLSGSSQKSQILWFRGLNRIQTQVSHWEAWPLSTTSRQRASKPEVENG